jgi:hypothetical protein
MITVLHLNYFIDTHILIIFARFQKEDEVVKKLINIVVVFVMLVVTVTSQSPVITQTAQFVVGSTNARSIKAWGEDFIASRYSYDLGASLPYHEELIFLNQLGEEVWRREFAPRALNTRNHLVISGDFCIFVLGDSLYKINLQGEILQQVKCLNSDPTETAVQSNGELVVMESNRGTTPSRLFVYSEDLNLIKTIIGQNGATYGVSQLGDAYFISGDKNGGGINTNASSHIARYDTTGNLLWIKHFPDIVEMRLVVNREKLYFCGRNVALPYQTMIYGELTKDSGNIIWIDTWGAAYPEEYYTLVRAKQMIATSDGGFVMIGVVTAPGQQIGSYEPNLPAGLVLGYSPDLNYLWVKITGEIGSFSSGDWKDGLLMGFGNLGSPVAAKVIIYSVSGLTAIEDDELGPKYFSLGQNYPNPFNPSTHIEFFVPETALTSLRIYDLLGREVATLVSDKELPAGKYEVSFEASDLASGMYIYILIVGRHAESRKMVILR